MTDLELCDLCDKLYSSFDGFHVFMSETGGRCFGLMDYPDCQVLVCRGSATIGDWLADFKARYVDTPDLGGVEAGFHEGPSRLIKILSIPGNGYMPLTGDPKPLYITGHSLGAAEGLILASLLCQYGAGKSIKGVTVFASPRPGGPQLDEILGKANIPVTVYLNHLDPVPSVPIPLLIPHWPYTHPARIVHIDERPSTPFDSWGLLACHHLSLYRTGVEKLQPKL